MSEPISTAQHSARAATQGNEAIGKSRGGNTTKIHLAVDAYGLPVEFIITGGEVNDCTAAPELITQLESAEAVIADKGYDSERLREQIEKQYSRVVIPRKRNSVKGNGDLAACLGNYFDRIREARSRRAFHLDRGDAPILEKWSSRAIHARPGTCACQRTAADNIVVSAVGAA